MPRSYSPELKAVLDTDGKYSLGADLGRTCVQANLPAKYVSEVLDVSRMTLHSWFRGGVIRFKKHEKIEALIILIEKDMKRGVLPAKNLKEACIYTDKISVLLTADLSKESD